MRVLYLFEAIRSGVPEYGCTMAQLAPELKNRVNHRGAAAVAAVGVLERLLSAHIDPGD